MIEFEPVWVSTDEHLKQFFSIYKGATLVQRFFGTYNFPPKFPYHVYWMIFFPKKIPAVSIAGGVVNIDDTHFSLQSKPFRRFGFITKNMSDLEFDLTADEIIRISPAKAESPEIQYLYTPFIRVETKRDGLLNNFLIGAGAKGSSLRNIRSQSDEFFLSLAKMKATNH